MDFILDYVLVAIVALVVVVWVSRKRIDRIDKWSKRRGGRWLP